MTRASTDTQRVFLIILRGAWGAALVLAPDDLVGGSERSVKLGARLLGVRHLTEAGLMARRPAMPPPRWSIALDALHGLSMLALASLSRNLRGVAVRSAAGAFTFVALSAYERSSAGAVASSDASAVATSRG